MTEDMPEFGIKSVLTVMMVGEAGLNLVVRNFFFGFWVVKDCCSILCLLFFYMTHLYYHFTLQEESIVS